ncbi:PREDICTED: transcription factor TCP18-like [Nelumbo nucifera]|uniref:Transcription factor CYCLOIDEA-like n=2 Tax=Nelumbo nucifera TaxID=4432 RepID=A0A822YM42_NELNU|nr:PREDICTED: transcription factor TCP18-like [Nelumbo nucifera]DAD35244.1 TPA_asm: hypothetical protein HUJ06_005884 [Nelumbo nucifera]
MFPASFNSVTGNSVSFTDYAMLGEWRNLTGDFNSKQETTPSSFFNFPPFFIDCCNNIQDDDNDGGMFFQRHYELPFCQLLPQQILSTKLSPNTIVADPVIAAAATHKYDNHNVNNKPIDDVNASNTNNCAGRISPERQILRKRSSRKKDRHSKIFTSQGPRDRRVRLSLQIARKFFDLQDMLGFDKASKTVEWLLRKSKAAIRELAQGLPEMKPSYSGFSKCVSSTSQCEAVSGVDEAANAGDWQGTMPAAKKSSVKDKNRFHPVARESRARARERARERTRKKIWSRSLEESKRCPAEAIPGEYGYDEWMGSHSHERRSSVNMVAAEVEGATSYSVEHQATTNDIVVEPFMAATNKSSPCSIFNQHENAVSQGLFCDNSNNNDFPNFSENWELDYLDRIHSTYCAMSNLQLSSEDVQERIPISFCYLP